MSHPDYIALVLTLLLLSAAAEPSRGQSAQPGQHLRYFGYYHSDGFHSKPPGLLPQIARLKNSNIAMINGSYGTDDMRALLSECARDHMQAFVNTYDCFFEWKPGKVGQSAMLADWQVRWSALKESIRKHEGTVLGFYFDEPYWNGVTEADFRTATRLIRREFPTKKVFACVTVLELDPKTWRVEIPEVSRTYYDFTTDCAYDCYAKWSSVDYKGLLDRLKSNLTKGQKLWMVPWLFTRGTPQTSPEVLAEHLKGCYSLALTEPRCVGLVCFSFASGDSADWGSGGDRLFEPASPSYSLDLKKLHLAIGRGIVRGAPPAP